ncbi:MAG TPA: DUF2235 domain-containing protein [Gemmatimonadaceae bacterium]
MRRLVVCADGTWNKPEEDDHGVPAPTNVVKMQRAIKAVDSQGTSQIVYYHSGVGTGDTIDQFLGGAFGEGIDRNILECYEFLVNNYHPGDQIYLFGFSRGAYTVRSLAGLIRNSGIVQQKFAGMAKEAFSMYRDRDPAKHPNSELGRTFRASFSREVDVDTVGVWDTVGALGVPLGLFDRLNHTRFAFHDVSLSAHIKNAFHALAIDERRGPFVPTLWAQPREDAEQSRNWLEQAWFAGVHSNVGGGYAEAGLSDIALRWMVQRVKAHPGTPSSTTLEFDDAYVAELTRPNEFARLYDSMTTTFRALGEVQRRIDQDREQNDRLGVFTWEYVHDSAKSRLDAVHRLDSPYEPENLRSYITRDTPSPVITDSLKARAARVSGAIRLEDLPSMAAPISPGA